ncbi:unnamed protein product, partial [Brenthis ino]
MDATKSDIIIASFNCRSIKRSLEHVRSLCKISDILVLQETWLLPHDIDFIHRVDEDFGCFAKSSVDTSTGIMRGRPYGGLALFWRKSIFLKATIIECSNNRLAAMRLDFGDNRQLLIINVYMPTDQDENLCEFTATLANIKAIIDDNEIETVFVLGDFNAHCVSRFGDELMSFCAEHSLLCVDYDVLGKDSNSYTYGKLRGPWAVGGGEGGGDAAPRSSGGGERSKLFMWRPTRADVIQTFT